MALTLTLEPDGFRRGRDEYWEYEVISWKGEHRITITRIDDPAQKHIASMYTRKGAVAVAREFHKLGEDYDPSAYGGRSRIEQAEENIDEP